MIKALRDALFSVVDAIDITAVYPEWEWKGTYPPKQIVCPAFWVEPVSNDPPVVIDTISAQITYTFAVVMTNSYENAPVDEDTVVELADLLLARLQEATFNTEALGEGLEAAFDGGVSGTWSFDERYGERVYRMEVSIKAVKTFS